MYLTTMKSSCCCCLLLLLLAAPSPQVGAAASSYEVWGSDQSNSVPGQDALGVEGSWLWIWKSNDIEDMLSGGGGSSPVSLPCSPDAETGPCDLRIVFPETLTDASSGEALGQAMGFGRWHGITKDPQNKYVTSNIFAPNGGYIGIVDTETKGAVALFRVADMFYLTGPDTNVTSRNVHMSFWNSDGSAILVHNLAGKTLERINVDRDDEGKIIGLTLDKSATLGFGKGMQVVHEGTFYVGANAFGEPLIGATTGSYEESDLGDLITPTSVCKENGCSTGIETDSAAASSDVGRPNNVGICPVMSSNGLAFNTFGGGGLLVVDTTQTPMKIVGGYGNSVVYGAGVCGTQVSDRIYLTSGVSASDAGATQSMFTLYAFDPTLYSAATGYSEENSPVPVTVYDDEVDTTATGGKTMGNATNDSGQIPGTTTRRDAHDVAGTLDGKYVHVVDRIQNTVDVFDSATNDHVGTYDLTTATGVVGDGTVGPCSDASVTDGGDNFPINDPAPDFIDATPDGKYMMLSFRGPAPVSAGHAAQGSCPGVGIVELLDGGASGKLVGVLRSINTVPDNLPLPITPPGGAPYSGSERSDVHDAVVVFKEEEAAGPTPSPPAGTASSAGAIAAGFSFTAFLLVLFVSIAGY